MINIRYVVYCNECDKLLKMRKSYMEDSNPDIGIKIHVERCDCKDEDIKSDAMDDLIQDEKYNDKD